MAKKLDSKEVVDFRELLTTNAIMMDTLAQLLMDKGLITYDEFFAKLRDVRQEYLSKGHKIG